MSTPTIVNVGLGDRAYDIEIGSNLIETIPAIIEKISPGARCAIITDENVNRHHGDRLRETLDNAGIGNDTICLKPGEATKSWPALVETTDSVLGLNLERNDLVLAFGGGVIGDLAGFAASIARRGMKFLQIPTSLLAQVDSSVGGKTGINSKHGKNLVGAFHQPSHVTIDLDVLKSLPIREFRAGYAEVVKYGLIRYPQFFAWLEKQHIRIFQHGDALKQAIAHSCKAKAEIVARDEKESGERALLNLGHTFGHALEGYTGYDGSRLVHGEAVAIGMALAHRFSNRLNHCSQDDVDRVEAHLAAVGLSTTISAIPGDMPSADTLMKFIAQDKKVQRGALTFILTKGIGKAYIAHDVPASEVQQFLQGELAR